MNKWTKNILKEQGLDKWKIRYWKRNYGGTLFKEKIIVLPKKDDIHSLFLHEVAHAILGKRHTEKYNHDVVWGDFYTVLCKDYLLPR